MTARSIGGIIAAATLTLLLAACGGTPPAPSSSSSTAVSSVSSSASSSSSSAAMSAEVSSAAMSTEVSASAASSSAVSSSSAPASSSVAASPVGPTTPVKIDNQIDQMKLMAPMAIPDKVIGSPTAKVTMIEYLSPSCPHCALVANTVIGPFKDKYVTTGKVKLILRPFARNTLDAGIFMLAEAAAKSADGLLAPAASTASSASSSEASPPAPATGSLPASYSQNAAIAWENVIDAFFKTQNVWAVSDRQLDAVKQMALQLGFTEETFNTALQDQDLFHRLQTMVDQAVNDFSFQGTPTFYINGKQITGEQTLDELSSVIDPML